MSTAYPDFNASFFSLNRLKPLLASEGALLLRKFLPGALISPWAPVFAAGWQQTEQRFFNGDMPEREVMNFYRFGHPLPTLIENFDQWINTLFGQLALRNLLRTLYGPEVCIIGSASLPRVQHPQLPERALPWHQDYEYIGPVKQTINVWIPLTPAGGDYPGLELRLGAPQQPLLQLDQSEAEREALLAEIAPESLWRPQLQPGDVLIFTPYTLHRTCLLPNMT
ncbi:MAG: hypothetical protein CVV27_04470, partial [Candidatus Melainabacteria bacterium HGW-Melainabacteria-1]